MADVIELKAVESPRVAIKIDTHEYRVVNQAVSALTNHPDVYQRGGSLVQVITDSAPPKGVTRAPGSPHIARVREPRLREMLSEQCDFMQLSSAGPKKPAEWRSTHVPKWVAEQAAARDQWRGIRHLEAVSATPMLRPDGSVIEQPGYDEATGVLYLPSRKFPRVAERVSLEQAVKALEFLCDVFVDFPFAAPEHRSCVIAGVLTPLARHAFAGPAPLVLIDKNVRGAGGSLLADTIAMCATGRGIARMVQSANEEEDKKRIFSIALAGDTMVLIDNITKPLGGAALDSALTGVEIRDRVLGKTGMDTAPLLACWFATGNNVQVLGDTLRRILPVRLESQHEKPEERQGFRHYPLLPYVENEHPKLVVAALTILKGYAQAKHPAMGIPSWGSFEGWSNLVRQALVWVGMEDPGKARQQLTEGADSEAAALRIVFENWRLLDPTGTGVTAARMLEEVNSTDPEAHTDAHRAIREALMELAPNAFVKGGSPKSLGRRLEHFKGRIIGGHALDARTGHLGKTWLMRRIQAV